MAFKIKRFIPASPLQEVTGPGKGKKKKPKNTTDRKVVRKIARQASKDSKEGKSTLIETGNSSWKKKGGGKTTTYDSKDGNKKVKKREIKKALKNVNAGRGDKVVVDKGEVRTIKKKPLTRDQRIAALKKKKADGAAKLAAAKAQRKVNEAAKRKAFLKNKADKLSKLNAAKAKRSAEIAAKRKALKAKQDAVRAKKGYKK